MTRRKLAWKIAKAAAITVACLAVLAAGAAALFFLVAAAAITNLH